MPAWSEIHRTTAVPIYAMFVALAAATTLVAQVPPTAPLPDARLNWVFPAGGRIGTTFDVTVDGFDLDNATKLVFDHPGITGVPKLTNPQLGQTGPQPVPNVFTVSIPADVKQGIYEVRVLGKYGLSSPRAFAVGNQPEITETEPNSTFKQANPVQIGTTINGAVKETTTDYFKFSAVKGQRIIIDCWAFRIDSHLAATLVLYNAAGKELDRNRHANRRDAMLDFTVPEDGEYVVALYDFVYNYYMLPGYSFYRLSISTAPYLDYIFPPAGIPGSTGQFTLYGRNLPGGQPAGISVGGKALEKLPITVELPAAKARHLGGDLLVAPSEAFIDGIEYRLDSPAGISNPLLISMAGAPVGIEQEPNNDPAMAVGLQLPCEVAGQFYPPGDQDWFTFEARKGDTCWIEVFSQRLGLPTDPQLVVQQWKADDKGVVQKTDLHVVDDMPEVTSFVHWSFLSGVLFNTSTHDPCCRFVAPEDGTYRILVRDMARLADASPRSVYRLLIRAPQPDFRLVAVPRPPTAALRDQSALDISQSTVWSPLLRKGGSELIEVFAMRRDGFDGEIRVSVDNLPQGVTCTPALLSPVSVKSPEPVKRSTTLILQAASDAPSSITSLAITGKALIDGAQVVREARTASMIWPTMINGVTYPRSRLVRQLALTVDSTDEAPFSLEVGPDLVLETSRLGTVKFPVKVDRRGDFKGPVMLKAVGLPLIPGNVVHSQLPFCAPQEIKADQEIAEFTMDIPVVAPTGRSTFFLSGAGTVKYSHNPQVLQAAQERKAAIEKIVADDAARVTAATTAQAEAEKTRLAAHASRTKLMEELKVAEKAVADAQAAATTATTKLAEAQAALDKDAGNANLVAARQAAETIAQDAAGKLKVAQETRGTAEKGVTAATELLKLTTEAKAAADKVLADADATAKQHAAFQQTFNQEFAKLQEKCKPTDLTISSATSAITLSIATAPVSLEPLAANPTLKQGSKLEIVVPFKRLYGFADPIRLTLQLQPTVAGIGIPVPTITVPAEQTQGSFVIDAAPTAPPGGHSLTVTATVTIKGQYTSVTREFPLTIEAVDPAR